MLGLWPTIDPLFWLESDSVARFSTKWLTIRSTQKPVENRKNRARIRFQEEVGITRWNWIFTIGWDRKKAKEMELLIIYNSRREVVRLSYDELSISTLRRLVSSTYAVPESLGLGFTYRGTWYDIPGRTCIWNSPKSHTLSFIDTIALRRAKRSYHFRYRSGVTACGHSVCGAAAANICRT